MSGALYVGIDLGTSNSAAAVFDGASLEMVRNPQGTFLTPSVVRIDARGTSLVGARARRYLDTHPQDVAIEFKRLMGTRHNLHFASADLDRTPVELAAEVLRSLRADIEAQTRVAPACAVISVPALFELPQCQDTSAAARMAGFERCELIAEPVASALAAGWRAETAGGSWLVYDLGGGTFDVSLLEEQEGFLHVVGHDGDNFLGGRDFDLALVGWALDELEREQNVRLSPSDPAHRLALARIKQAAEEARIELSRTSSTVMVLADHDLELPVDQATLERLCMPLVDRSIAVCKKLLAQHAAQVRRLSRIVLVGGPTVTPFLRRRVNEALNTQTDGEVSELFGEQLDPMTLVARGAALHAASAGLNAIVDAAPPPRGRLFSLSYPAMTSDPSPVVVGHAVRGDEPLPHAVRWRRDDGWTSDLIPLGEDGVFVATVELLPHQATRFQFDGVDRDGAEVAVQPSGILVVHGVTVGSPPLTRTVGVATANDEVRVFFPRGTALPCRKTWTLRSVETLPKGAAERALEVPIVQGESKHAHLCRVVGRIVVSAAELTATLPVGSDVEVTLELDRSGQLSGHALVPMLGQRFDQVAQLLLPEADATALESQIEPLKTRLEAATLEPGDPHFDGLLTAGLLITQAVTCVEAARGGDADAGQKARRLLLEIDEILERAESTSQWRDLEQTALEVEGRASVLIEQFGTDTEKSVLQQLFANLERARLSRQMPLFEMHLKVLNDLADAAFLRRPDATELMFSYLVNRVDQATDAARMQSLMLEGRKARDAGDDKRLRRVVDEMWRLQPYHRDERKLGYDSGVR